MLVRTTAELDLLLDAQQEVRALGGSTPPERFYTEKLARAWERATATAMYATLDYFDPKAFAALELTSRAQLKADPWSSVAVGWDRTAKYYETTGTSGQVTPTPRTTEDILWNGVSVAEAWRDVLSSDDRVAIMLPSDVVPVTDLVVTVSEYLGLPHVRCYPFTYGISDYDRVFAMWHSFRPTVLVAAPGVAMQTTRFLKQRHELARLSESVRTIMLLGEVSTEPFRDRLGRSWGADVYDASYGSTETGTLAATCRHGRAHLLTATNYFELAAADGTPVALRPGARGRLVVTPLNLHARPLLRLDTGDEVVIEPPCTCGRQTPVITVCGRDSDVVRVRDIALTIRDVEEVVYGTTSATGYLIELDAEGDHVRLLLERDVDGDRSAEAAESRSLQCASATWLGLSWDSVTFVNSVPAVTKAGGSRKSWKRSNIRMVGSS